MNIIIVRYARMRVTAQPATARPATANPTALPRVATLQGRPASMRDGARTNGLATTTLVTAPVAPTHHQEKGGPAAQHHEMEGAEGVPEPLFTCPVCLDSLAQVI